MSEVQIRVHEAASFRLDEIYRYTRDRWGEQQAERFGYRVAYRGIGEEDAELGPPTQMAWFSLGPVAQA